MLAPGRTGPHEAHEKSLPALVFLLCPALRYPRWGTYATSATLPVALGKMWGSRISPVFLDIAQGSRFIGSSVAVTGPGTRSAKPTTLSCPWTTTTFALGLPLMSSWWRKLPNGVSLLPAYFKKLWYAGSKNAPLGYICHWCGICGSPRVIRGPWCSPGPLVLLESPSAPENQRCGVARRGN